MEHLMTYKSDEDSNSDADDNCCMSKNDVDASNSNFFNFTAKLRTTPSKHVLDSLSEQNQKKKVGELEIPDSDFWCGFDPNQSQLSATDVSSSQSPSSSGSYRKRNHDGEISHHGTFSGNSRQYRSNVHNKSNNSATEWSRFETVQHKKHSHSLLRTAMINDLPTETRISKGVDDSESVGADVEIRKIFFVHNKVMPGLSHKLVCKNPSMVDSSWSCHDKAINRISWNTANYSHLIATAGMDSVIRICNVWSQLDKCVSSISSHTKAVRTALWGNSGKRIISTSYDRTAAVTDVESGTVVCRFTHDAFVTSCAKHPSNPHCFVTGSENLIQMWDQRQPTSSVKNFHFKVKLGQIQDLLFIQDGHELLSCADVVARDSADKTIMAWDIRTGVVLSNQIFQERYTCTRLKLHPSNSHFLAQTQGSYVAAFSASRPYKMDKSKRFQGHQMRGYNIGFDISHDGKFLYSGSAEGGVHCYDYRSGRLLKKCCTDKNSVITDVACHPVLPSVVAASSWGGQLSLWR